MYLEEELFNMSNKSKPYGYYGGVTQQNHYVPPPSIPFIPQPASIPFVEDYAQKLEEIRFSVEETQKFFTLNKGSIMRRYLIERTSNQELYKITTIDNPTDVIIYTTSLSGVEDLLLLDGGEF